MLEDFLLVNNPKNAKCGWKKINDKLVIEGPYCSDMEMEAIASINLSEEDHHLSFDLLLDAEPDYDFFYVTIIVNDHEETLVAPESHSLQKHFDLDLERYKGKKVEIKIKLSSDEMGSGKGATLSNFKFL
jgi:hypothetical protein